MPSCDSVSPPPALSSPCCCFHQTSQQHSTTLTHNYKAEIQAFGSPVLIHNRGLFHLTTESSGRCCRHPYKSPRRELNDSGAFLSTCKNHQKFRKRPDAVICHFLWGALFYFYSPTSEKGAAVVFGSAHSTHLDLEAMIRKGKTGFFRGNCALRSAMMLHTRLWGMWKRQVIVFKLYSTIMPINSLRLCLAFVCGRTLANLPPL